jgi:trans-AT polyketide synthase/acyltransferase/oxidoreductase domain-containing protein
VAAAFLLGADFVLTGSVNQCTVEAGTSDTVKDLLATMDIQDTTYAPAGDMFEIGARVQVLRKGTLFAARGNKLLALYRHYDDWSQIDERTRATIESTYFGCSFDEAWAQVAERLRRQGRIDRLRQAEGSGKHRMALVFRWYFARTVRMALEGDPARRANYQVQIGPALGAFNRFVEGTPLEDWRRRHVDGIAELLMSGAAQILQARAGIPRSIGTTSLAGAVGTGSATVGTGAAAVGTRAHRSPFDR